MLCRLHVNKLKACLDCNEEVHRSQKSREGSNMLDYEMCSSSAKVCTTAKTPQVEKFNHG